MSVSNAKSILLFAFFLAVLLVPSLSAAETVQYSQTGSDMSSNRLVVSDFTITSERPDLYPGDTLELSYVISSEAFYPMLVSLPNGIHFKALDPEGDLTVIGGAYVGQYISPGESILIKSRMTVDEAGTWTIWPAYNAQNSHGVVQYNPKEWAAAEIFIDEEYVPMPDLVIIEAGSAGTTEDGTVKRFYYTVENSGPLSANKTTSRILVNGVETIAADDVGMLPAGESQKVFFTLDNIQKGDMITILLDASGEIEELDEDNNEWSFAVNLQNDVAKVSGSGTDDDSSVPGDGSAGSSDVIYYTTDGSQCDVGVQFMVLGALSVLMSGFAFALGYYYCLSRKYENEIGWMYSKMKRMDTDFAPARDYNSGSGKDEVLREDIPEPEEVFKGNSGAPGDDKKHSGDEKKSSEGEKEGEAASPKESAQVREKPKTPENNKSDKGANPGAGKKPASATVKKGNPGNGASDKKKE